MNRLKSIFLICAAILLTPCSQANADQHPLPIRIGMIYSLTGPADSWTAYGRQAAELAAKEINLAGGVGGRKLELVFEDSKTTSAGAVAAYQKLVKVDKVDALIGDVWDFVTNPLVPLTTRDRIVLISPTVVPDAIESHSDYFYTMGSQIGLTREAVKSFFDLNPAVRTIAVIRWDNQWGRAFASVWKEVAAARGISLLDERAVYGFDYDYRTDAAGIARKRPDAVIMGYQEERIIRRLREQGFHPKILSTSNLAAVNLQKLLTPNERVGNLISLMRLSSW